MTSIEIPESVTSIGDDAFLGCSGLTIYGTQGSYAESYARRDMIPFKVGKIPESPKPSESPKPEESKKPVSKKIPVEKAQDGIIQVQGSRYVIKAAEKALEIAQNIYLIETDLTRENSAEQYDRAKETLKEYNPSHMQLFDMRFVDQDKKELGLQDKVTISFSVPEGFNPDQVAVARLNAGMKTEEATKAAKEYTLYETVISDDKKTATIETDQMGTFVIMEIGKEEMVKGDLDGDGRITLKDAQTTLKVALNLFELDNGQKQVADVNGDGKVNLGDAQLILKKSLNLIDTWK